MGPGRQSQREETMKIKMVGANEIERAAAKWPIGCLPIQLLLGQLVATEGAFPPSAAPIVRLSVALWHGWIDSHRKARGKTYFLQKYTPRRPGSSWSRLNVERAEALIAASGAGIVRESVRGCRRRTCTIVAYCFCWYRERASHIPRNASSAGVGLRSSDPPRPQLSSGSRDRGPHHSRLCGARGRCGPQSVLDFAAQDAKTLRASPRL